MPQISANDDARWDTVYDVVIVGAGPCGLAVAARLRETHPSALFTDAEQARYHWLSRNAHRFTVKTRANGRLREPPNATPGQSNELSMLVLDSSGDDWMTRWHANFANLQISHLRSPMFFHPDPSDRDALLAFAHASGDPEDAQEIAGCVGKELSKHQRKKKKRSQQRSGRLTPAATIDQRDQKDYFAPSSMCFRGFCQACISRYGLNHGVLRHEEVSSITYGPSPEHPELDSLFAVRTAAARYTAKTVVLATGPGQPCIPAPFLAAGSSGASHAMQMQEDGLLGPRLQAKIRGRKTTRVLVIGGGLTSAQIADTAIKAGVSSVWLLMRGAMKVKPFDIDLTWMSKFQNHQRASFWSSDSFEERASMIATARNGGSITPRYIKRLHSLAAEGRLEIRDHTVVASQSYDEQTGLWTIATDPPIPELPTFDHIIFATGSQGSLTNLPFLEDLHQKHPVEECCGLPILTDDLQWSKDIPLFVTGRLAGLQLGPGAGNLEGARLGAERVVWAIEEMLHRGKALGNGVASERSETEDYAAGIGSKFRALQV